MIALFGLAILSVTGAFLGAERARMFFNSVPMIVVWAFLLALLASGLLLSPAVRNRPASFAMHLGCLLVLAGSMWNSTTAHHFRTRFLRATQPASGFMLLKPGETSDALRIADLTRPTGSLPFSLQLDEFRIEHYPLDGEPWMLGAGIAAHGPEGMNWLVQSLDHTRNEAVALPFCDIRALVTKRTEARVPDASPIVELDLIHGTQTLHRVMGGDVTRTFHQLPLSPLFPNAVFSNRSVSLLLMKNDPPVKDYISRVTVMRDGQAVAHHSIEVNHPLHYGGYHVYQHSCDNRGQRYTILYAVEDNGLRVVYGGFLLLGLGVALQFWIRRRPSQTEGAA